MVSKKLQDIAYQSDITPETKYMLDNNLQFSRKRHIAFFDIETFYDIENDPEGNSVDNADSPITSICFYSNFLSRYFVLAWHPDQDTGDDPFIIKELGKDKDLYLCKNEAVVLDTFCYLIKELNVDIITGWYSHGYDVPYIMKRLVKLFGTADKLSPVGNTWLGNKGVYDGYFKIKIRGLDSIDLMQVVQSLNYNLQNNKLDTAAGQILGDKYRKLKTSSWRDWQDNFNGFIKYAIRDVEILYLIDKKLKVFEYLIQMQILSGINSLNDIMSVTRLIDAMFIKKFWNKLVFPDNKESKRVSFKGGLTIDPTSPGVHEGVAVLDYASLYPTTIMAYNISPQTFLFSKGQLGQEQFQKELQFLKDNDISFVDTGESQELFGGRYIFLSHKEHIGCLPSLSYELYTMRKQFKKIAKKGATADERLVADKKQYAIKIILNSIYGAMGFPFFRLFVPECADAVTFFGRKALRFAMDKMSPCGLVLYGDTDSVFIKLKVDENTLKEQLEQFNKEVLPDQLIKRFNPCIDPKYLQYELEHEKNLSYLYLGDRKKRYYSIQQDGSKYIHGLNIIKKDTPAYIKQLLDQLCERAVTGKFSVSDLEQVYNKIKTAELDEIAVHKSITKRFEKYNKTIPQHVSGALFANEHLGLKIKHSDVVYLFYINSFCEPEIKPGDRKNVVCLRKEDFPLIATTDKFQIDYNELMEKQFIQPLREFNKIPQVQKAIDDWGKLFNDNYRINNKGQFVFKKRKF